MNNDITMLQDEEIVDKEDYYLDQKANDDGTFSVNNPARWQGSMNDLSDYEFKWQSNSPSKPEDSNTSFEVLPEQDNGIGLPNNETNLQTVNNTYEEESLEAKSRLTRKERKAQKEEEEAKQLAYISAQWDEIDRQYMKQYHSLQYANESQAVATAQNDVLNIYLKNGLQVLLGAGLITAGTLTGMAPLIALGGGQVLRGFTNFSLDIGWIDERTSKTIKTGIDVAEVVGTLGAGAAKTALKVGTSKLLTKEGLKQIGKRVAKEAYKQGIFDTGSLAAEELTRAGLALKGAELEDWINERPEKRGWLAAGIQFTTNAITTASQTSALAWGESAIASAINDKPIYASGLLGRMNETMDMGRQLAPITQFGRFKKDEDGNIMYDENGHPIEEQSYYDMTLWQQMGTATFWQNQLASAGFSVGAAIGGAQISKRFGGITNELRAIKNGVKVEELLGKPMKAVSKALFNSMNGLAMACPEASVEAYAAYNDYIRNNTEKIKQDYLDGKIDAMQYQQAISVLGEGARVFGNQVFFENLAILTASNSIVWGQMFSRGFASSIRSGGSLGAGMANIFSQPALSEVESAARRFGINIVRDASGKVVTGATIKSVGESLGKSGLNLLKKGISEGLEEGFQGVAQSNVRFMPELTSYYYNSTRPDGWRMAKEYLTATFQSLLYNAKGGDQSYEQIAGGFIMGILGLPGFTRSQSGRIMPRWNGGIGETIRDITDYTKARGFTERLNAQLQDSKSDISIVLKTLAGQAADSMDARLALLQNDNFGFENARESTLIRTLYMAEALGLSEELYGNVADAAIHMTEDEVNNLRQLGIIGNISISSAEYAKKMNEYGVVIREKIDKFKRNLGLASMIGLNERDTEIFVAACMKSDNFNERAKSLQKEIEDAIGMSLDDFFEGNGQDRKFNYDKYNQKLNEVAANDPTILTKEEDRQKNIICANEYSKFVANWMSTPASMSRYVDNEINVRLNMQDGMRAALLASEIAKAKTKEEVIEIIKKSSATDEVAKTALIIASQEGNSIANTVRRSRGVRSSLMNAVDGIEYTTLDGKKVSGSDLIDAILQEAETSGKKYTDLRYEDIAKILLNKFKIILQQDELRDMMGAIDLAQVNNSLEISIQDALYNSERAKGERKQILPNLPIRQRKRAEEKRRLQDDMRKKFQQYDTMNTTGNVVNVKYNNVDYTIEHTDAGLEVKDNTGNTVDTSVANKIIRERGRELRRRLGSAYYDTEWGNLSATGRVIVIRSVMDDMPTSRTGRYVLVSSDAQIDALNVDDKVKDALRNDPGLTDGNTIYINAQNTTSLNDLVKTYFHESSHFGLRNLFADRSGNTDRFDRLCVNLFNYALRADVKSSFGKKISDLALRYLQVTDIRNSNGVLADVHNQELLGDEIISSIAEEMINDETNEFEKSGFLSIIRASLRSLVRDRLGIDIGFTDNDIRALITRSINRLERGQINQNVTVDTRERVRYDENEHKNVNRLDNEAIVEMLSDGDISSHTSQDFENAKDLVGLLQKQFGVPALVIADENHDKALSKHIKDIINKELQNVRKKGSDKYGLVSGKEQNNLYINFKQHNSLNEVARTYVHELIHKSLHEYLGEDSYKDAMETLWNRIKKTDSPYRRIIEEDDDYKNLSAEEKGEEVLARFAEEQITEKGEITPVGRELDSIDKERIEQINNNISNGKFNFNDSVDLVSALLRHKIHTSKKSAPKYMPYVVTDPSSGNLLEEGLLEYGVDNSIRNAGDRTFYDNKNKSATLSFRKNELYQIISYDKNGDVLSITKRKDNYIIKEDANGKVISKEKITRPDGLNTDIRRKYGIGYIQGRSENNIESEIVRHASNDKDYMSREERRKRSGLIRERISSIRERKRGTEGRNELRLQSVVRNIIRSKSDSLKRSNPEMFSECKQMLYDMIMKRIADGEQLKLRASTIKGIKMMLDGELTEEEFDKSEDYNHLRGQWDKWGDKINAARRYIRDNWDAIMSEVSRELAHDEGIIISTYMMSKKQYRNILENEGYEKDEIDEMMKQYDTARKEIETSEATDEIDLGLKEEYFDYSVRYTDEVLTMSSKMQVELANLISYDNDGNMKINEKTGLPSRQNSKYIYYVLVEALSDSRNKKDFFNKLKALENRFGWARDLIAKVEADPDMRAGIYATFRKSTVVPRVLDSMTGKVKGHFENTAMRFRARLIYENFGRNVTNDAVFGNDGLVNDKGKVNALIREINKFVDNVNVGIDEDTFKKKMCEFFSKCGLVVEPEDIRGDLINKKFNLNAMIDFLEVLRDGKLDNVTRLDTARKLRSMLEVTERTAHIGMLRLNGVGYAAHVSMSYLEDRLLNLCRGDSKSIAEYVRKNFGEYENFASHIDGDTVYFFDWLEDLAYERLGMEYAEVMSISGRAPEKAIKSVADYISMAFQVYRSSSESERFVLPCLGHSGRLMYIDHEGRMSREDIREGLKKVVMREIKLACMKQGGKETGSKDFALIPELPGLLANGKVVLRNRDGSTVKLDMETVLSDDFSEEMAGACADALIDSIQSQKIDTELYDYWVVNEDAGSARYHKKDKFASEKEFEAAYKDFLVRNYYAQTQISAMIGADPAFLDSDVNYSKRLQGLQGCNTRPADQSAEGENDKMGVVILKDEVVDCIRDHAETAELVDAMEADGRLTHEQAEKARERLSNVTSTDGQSYMTLDSYRDYLMSVNHWDEHLEEKYQAVKRGEFMDIEDFQNAFTPLKLAGYGEYVQELPDGTKIKRPYMIKTSFMPILPIQNMSDDMPGLENKKLMAIAKYMEKTGAKIACFESSCKVGSKDALSVEDILSGKGGNVAFEIDSWELGMQQVEKTEATDVEVSSGRQRINLALTNIRSMGSLEIGGKTYTAEQIEQIYLAALAAKAEKQYRENVAPLLKDEESIVEAVEDMARRLGEASGLDGFEEAVEQGLPMHMAPGQKVLQGVILSILKKGAISNRQYGQVNVQCYAYSDDLHLVIRESKDGRKYLAGMECYMPAPSKKIIEKYATQEGGVWRIDMEKMPDELKKAIGTRIPTAGYGAMKVLYVKGFLNPVHGSQIMLPVEAMVFDGSDFDIDKIFEICPHFETKEDGNLGKVEYLMPTDATGKLDEAAMSKLSIAQLDNLLMDINELTWASPEGTAQIMQAGGYANIQDAKAVLEYIEEQRKKGYTSKSDALTVDALKKKLKDGSLKKKSSRAYNPLSLEANADGYFKGQLGKNIIAVIAATNAFVPSIQRSNVDLGMLSIYLGGDVYDTLAPVKGKFGQYVISLLGEKIDAAADMKKDDCLYSLCKDSNQSALSIALSILGIDPIHEVIFLNQPEVREYIKEFNGKQMTCYDILKFFGMQRVSPEGMFIEADKKDKHMSWDHMLKRTMAAPGSTEAQNDPRIVKQLIKLFLISQAITDANLYTSRFDKSEQGGFTGSTFAEYIDNMMKVRLGGDLSMQRIPALKALKEQLRQIAFKDDGNVDIENSRDRRQAELYKLIFEDFRKEIAKDGKFPWLTDEGLAVIERMYRQYGHYDYTTGTWQSAMNSEMLESFMNEYSQALMQNNDLYCRYVDEDGNEHIRFEALIRMIALFPNRISDFKYNEGFSKNPFLQALSMSESDKMLRYTIPNLDGLNLEQIEAIRDGWASLLDNGQTHRFALDMYRYALLISHGLQKFAPKSVIEAFYDENGNASEDLNEDGGAKPVMDPSLDGESMGEYTLDDYVDAWTDKNMVEGSLYTYISDKAAAFHIAQANPRFNKGKKRGKFPWECQEIWLTDNSKEDRMGTDNKTPSKYINWDGYIFKYVRSNSLGFPLYRRVDGIQLDDGSVKNYCDSNRSIRNDLDRLALIEDVKQYGIDNANEIASEVDDFDSFAGFDNTENESEQFTAEDYLEQKSAIEPTDKPNSELRRVFFDVETSDVYDKTKEGNLEEMPHVFQIGYIVTDFDGKVIEGDSILIKPDGWTISDEAAKVTGHTTEEIAKNPNAMSAKEALGILAQIMNDADCVVGHNVIFDNTVISAEFARAGLANPLTRAGLKVVDTMRTSYPNKLKDSNGNKKFWTNGELYKELGGTEEVKLHDALEDVRVTMANFTELQKRGYLNNDTAIRERRRLNSRGLTTSFSVLDNMLDSVSSERQESRVGRESACKGADGKNIC